MTRRTPLKTAAYDGIGVFDLPPGFYLSGGEAMSAYGVYDAPGPCENRCVFCLESEYRPVTAPPPLPPAGKRAILCRWEPLGLKDLPGTVRMLKTHGRPVLVATNGRRLDAKMAKGLVAAGLDEIAISLHGADASVHDALTRAPGSFAEAVAGARALGAARAGGKTRLGVIMVLSRTNVHQLREVFELAVSLGADAFFAAMIIPLGKGPGAAEHAPSLDEVFGAYAALAKRDTKIPACLVHFPPCAARGPGASRVRVVLAPRNGDFDEMLSPGWAERCAACSWAPHCEGMLSLYDPEDRG